MLTIKNFNKTPEIRTFTVSWTETSDPSSFNPVYSDWAAGLSAWSTEFDKFFWYYWVRLSKAWVETNKVKQSTPWTLDITKLWTLTSGDDVMIAFPKMWYKMSKSWSTVTLSLTRNPNKASEWYKYYAFTKWSSIKDIMYLWAYEMNSNYGSLSWTAPKVTQTRAQFRAGVASAYNDSWRHSLMTYRVRDFIKMLYMMKYGNPASRTIIWKWLTSWSAVENTWATNSITSATWATNTSDTWRIKLFWLEDIWWNVSELIDCCYSNSSSHLTVDNTNSIFQDSAYSTDLWTILSWFKVGIDWSTEWTFRSISTSWWSITTYYCAWNPATANAVLHTGGTYSGGDYAGILFTNLFEVNNSSTQVGSRLQFL